MNRLRKQIKTNPIIKRQFIHHEQPFLYQYHGLKIRFANKYPKLIYYLTNLEELLPKDIFKNSKRISETAKETPTTMARRDGGCPRRGVTQGFFKEKTVEAINVVGVSNIKNCNLQNNVVGVSKNNNLVTKNNYAVELAKLASSTTNEQRKAHQIIENFMLINDSTTIAVEVPIYYKNLTGHIDILQIRYNKLYILDYKPQLLAQLQ